MERLQKYISNSGYCSRRKAENLIVQGLVFVNGEKVTSLGTKVSDKDQVMIEGQILDKEDKVYFLLNKPKGYVSTVSDEHKRKTVIDLIETEKRVYPVGRLDYDTTGILILTNDGELTNLLMHPSNNIDKVYIVKVEGKITGSDIYNLKNGVIIDNEKTAPAEAKLTKYDKAKNISTVRLTIHEGKNHQVKKMFQTINKNVLKLKRESIAFLTLEGLNTGEYRKLNPKEVKKLYNDAKNWGVLWAKKIIKTV